MNQKRQDDRAEEPVGEPSGATADETDEAAPAEQAEPAEAAAAEPEAEEAAPAPEPDPLAAAQAEIAGLKDRLLRALAESENTRRRAARDREDAAKYAIAGFARDLMGVADNLERALGAVEPAAREQSQALEGLVSGVELTLRELRAACARHGIAEIEALGARFDPARHQAVLEIEDPARPPGTVVEVMQVGYMIKDRLLRPAMVAVSKGGKSEPETPQADADDAGPDDDGPA